MGSHGVCWKPHSNARARRHNSCIFPEAGTQVLHKIPFLVQSYPWWGQRRCSLEWGGMESAVAGSSVGSSWVKFRCRWSPWSAQCLKGKALCTQDSTQWNPCHPSACKHRGLRGKMLNPALKPWSFRSLRSGAVSAEVSGKKRSHRQLSTTGEKEQQNSFHFPLSVVLNVDKPPREPFRDIGHHQEGLGCQSFLLWQTAVCVWLWGLIFSFQVFVFTFFFSLLFASTLNHSGSYLWGWNNIRSDLLTVLQFPGSQNMGGQNRSHIMFCHTNCTQGREG